MKLDNNTNMTAMEKTREKRSKTYNADKKKTKKKTKKKKKNE